MHIMLRNSRLVVKNLLAFQDSRDPLQFFYKAKGERNSYPTFDRSHMNKTELCERALKLVCLPSSKPKNLTQSSCAW